MFFSQLKRKINPVYRQILNNPYYRLKNLEEVAIAAELGLKIDVNSATVDDWLRLPGLSIHQARMLVELRNNGVQFLSIEDIAAALNISDQRLKPLTPILDFCYYEEESLLTPPKTNLNLASYQELIKIPLLDENLIDKILSDRQANGNYKTLADFQQRLSLDSQVISLLMYYIQF